ncbi:MAG: EcsC family protein [Rhodobacterales bacterium]|nr:EcsC family protein [Rhodobacterales bacterium]
MDIIERPTLEIDLEAELQALAKKYRGANGLGMQVLNVIGGQAETLLAQLPEGVRDRIGDGTETALRLALKAAQNSRGVVGDQPGWLNTAMNTALGAAGGFGGLPSAMVELPVTTTVLLRSIQGVAAEHGFDPATEGTQFDCIQVFAAAGPLGKNDGADLAFYSTRVAVSGAAVQALIRRVAPKLAVVLGQKLAPQTVPVLGAIAGAATNYAYTSYYQDIAHVHFRLRKLAIETDRPHADLVEDLRERVAPVPVKTV